MRSREKIIRLAMIHAWTLGRRMVSLDSYLWGQEVVKHSDASVFGIMETAGGSDDHERKVNTILRNILRKPGVAKGRLIGDLKYDEQSFGRAVVTLVNGHKIKIKESSRGVITYHPFGDTE